MTEADWLTCTDPRQMLEFLRGKASQRKLRLFACACCRLVWHLLLDERSRAAVEAAERFADGRLTESDRQAVFCSACDVSRVFYRRPDAWPETTLRLRRQHLLDKIKRAAFLAAFAVGSRAGDVEVYIRSTDGNPVNGGMQARLLAEIFGNPFRRIPVNSQWLTPRVVALAQTIYDERTFEQMPVLADALEEAGCDRQLILAHCEGPGPHARGCWVVDLVLAKE